MSGWTIVIRTTLASLLGLLSLAASLCNSTDGTASACPEPVTATVSDQPARVLVTDEEEEAQTIDTTTVDSAATPVGAQVSDAIGEVRQQRGTLLDGTVLGNTGSREQQRREFHAVLKRVAAEQQAKPPVLDSQPPVVPALIPAAPTPEGSALLRQAARELETRAADNEDLRHFKDADRLRRLSNQLRREARRWDEGTQFNGPMY